jgi:hypothetical protein
MRLTGAGAGEVLKGMISAAAGSRGRSAGGDVVSTDGRARELLHTAHEVGEVHEPAQLGRLEQRHFGSPIGVDRLTEVEPDRDTNRPCAADFRNRGHELRRSVPIFREQIDAIAVRRDLQDQQVRQ